MRKCNQCNEFKNLSEFGNNRANPLGKSYMCKPCRLLYDKAHRNSNRQMYRDKSARHKDKKYETNKVRIWEELQKPCVDCGLIDPIAMEFDHRPDEKKLYNIGAMVGNTYSQETLEKEIAKCDLVCANCHRHRTNNRHGWWRELQPKKERTMTRCLAKTDPIPIGLDTTSTHYVCGKAEDADGTCEDGHHWGAIHAYRKMRNETTDG